MDVARNAIISIFHMCKGMYLEGRISDKEYAELLVHLRGIEDTLNLCSKIKRS